jgi:hypothetical protein
MIARIAGDGGFPSIVQLASGGGNGLRERRERERVGVIKRKRPDR